MEKVKSRESMSLFTWLLISPTAGILTQGDYSTHFAIFQEAYITVQLHFHERENDIAIMSMLLMLVKWEHHLKGWICKLPDIKACIWIATEKPSVWLRWRHRTFQNECSVVYIICKIVYILWGIYLTPSLGLRGLYMTKCPSNGYRHFNGNVISPLQLGSMRGIQTRTQDVWWWDYPREGQGLYRLHKLLNHFSPPNTQTTVRQPCTHTHTHTLIV